MTFINRVRCTWTGFVGQPGVSTFYFDSTVSDMNGLHTFLTGINTYLPSNVTITIPGTADQIADSNGVLVNEVPLTGGGAVQGIGGATPYSGATGFLVDWQTSGVVAGHRVHGRNFFVPAANGAYQNDGTIADAIALSIFTKATTMISFYATKFLVYSRPFKGRAASAGPPPKPALPARDGTSWPVIAAKVPDMAVVLRSRRD